MPVGVTDDINGNHQATVSWSGEELTVIDQRLLPGELVLRRLGSVAEVVEAIATLTVRGAPALAAAGAFGVVLACLAHHRGTPDGPVLGRERESVQQDAARLVATRPTAVNLRVGVERALTGLDRGPAGVAAAAAAMLAEDEIAHHRLAHHTADFLENCTGVPALHLLTLCNTGALAAAGDGTALGAIVELERRGRLGDVLVCETRPLLQGARLTTWELSRHRIDHRICVDSAGPVAVDEGLVDAVVVGADRVTAAGDVINKIGTYALALACTRAGVPLVVAAPRSTVDLAVECAADVPIEQRGANEVTHFGDRAIAVDGVSVYNPAFDRTPSTLVTGIITEDGPFVPAARTTGGE